MRRKRNGKARQCRARPTECYSTQMSNLILLDSFVLVLAQGRCAPAHDENGVGIQSFVDIQSKSKRRAWFLCHLP